MFIYNKFAISKFKTTCDFLIECLLGVINEKNDTGEEVVSPASPDISRLKRHESWLLSLGECKSLLIEE